MLPVPATESSNTQTPAMRVKVSFIHSSPPALSHSIFHIFPDDSINPFSSPLPMLIPAIVRTRTNPPMTRLLSDFRYNFSILLSVLQLEWMFQSRENSCCFSTCARPVTSCSHRCAQCGSRGPSGHILLYAMEAQPSTFMSHPLPEP